MSEVYKSVSYPAAKAGGIRSPAEGLADRTASACGRLTTAQPRTRMFSAAIRSARRRAERDHRKAERRGFGG